MHANGVGEQDRLSEGNTDGRYSVAPQSALARSRMVRAPKRRRRRALPAHSKVPRVVYSPDSALEAEILLLIRVYPRPLAVFTRIEGE